MTALLLSGCTTSDRGRAPAGPPRDLAATPEPLQPEERASTSPTASATAGPTGSPPISSSPASSSAQPPATFRNRARTTDPGGDAGFQAPAYADLASVVIESDGQDVRVTVDVRGSFPTPLADGEVMGIGVDLYRDANAKESDYQLFVDGGPDGWFAYLQTPDGFVDYPGSFRLGGARLVFQVPLASVGGLHATATGTFLDWTKGGTVINASGSDRAPDSGRAKVDP